MGNDPSGLGSRLGRACVTYVATVVAIWALAASLVTWAWLP